LFDNANIPLCCGRVKHQRISGFLKMPSSGLINDSGGGFDDVVYGDGGI
jgi:hypothetical protein